MDKNFKLPPLEEVLERVEGFDAGKDMGKGEIESPWYKEICPTAEDKNGNGEIRVKEGNYVNSVACKYYERDGNLCRPGYWAAPKKCDFC